MNEFQVYNWIIRIIKSSKQQHKESCEKLIKRFAANYDNYWLRDQLIKNYHIKFNDETDL